jgi:hypothetical protein
MNLRTAYSTYMAFKRYLDQADEQGKGDRNLASGAQLGCGTIGLILSLLPGKVLNVGLGLPKSVVEISTFPQIMSVFGFEGNREGEPASAQSLRFADACKQRALQFFLRQGNGRTQLAQTVFRQKKKVYDGPLSMPSFSLTTSASRPFCR